jgi:hypothetical protein
VKIYSNKEFSQLTEFSTKRTSSTRRFRKFVRTFYNPVETERKDVDEIIERSELRKEEEQVAFWKTYTRQGQDSCNYSYRLSKTEQLRSGFHHHSFLFVSLSRVQSIPCYFAKWCRRSVANFFHIRFDFERLFIVVYYESIKRCRSSLLSPSIVLLSSVYRGR